MVLVQQEKINFLVYVFSYLMHFLLKMVGSHKVLVCKYFEE